ncbi:hypothetical protein GCM10023194_29540 [Planotetraspora phitsanulokensis]|uniref:DUF1579 domain-containing protein n=1 Tax=Planotetraspora phitsanulokensis TaxID=575192 RepID=A0A8J3U002_9ACTN|nr:hypothetical protein [Planotetraspora phitsanulokensis]GII35908.1 hypothetical protein Pph01_09110 [Planotetraspora phitsanulokensis]
MGDRHPALARLDALVGRWAVQPKVPGLGSAWTEFAWQDDGAFLRQESDIDSMPATAPKVWQENAPFPTLALIGLDDAGEEFTMLYADARGVHRVYRMTFAEGEWRMWRDAPGFNQRFAGTLSPDGDTVEARWEMSTDGVTWSLDFELTYSRVRDSL